MKTYKAIALVSISLLLGSASMGFAERTELISVNDEGVVGNSHSDDPAISRDGRFVVFESYASNLVLNDNNSDSDIFLRDRVNSTTIRVSVSSTGEEGDSDSYDPAVSDSGQYVLFSSNATNLVDNDTNGFMDVFIRDTWNNTTRRVSVKHDGSEGDERSGAYGASLTGDGLYVVFDSAATNLVEGDTNDLNDIFLHDIASGQTSRINLSFMENKQAEGGGSIRPVISADGHYVAYETRAADLVPCDENYYSDILLRDLWTGTTSRVSVGTYSCDTNGHSEYPSISDDGRYVVFDSSADNLLDYTGQNDDNDAKDVFIRDRVAETTKRVSVNSAGVEGNEDSGGYGAGLSADGRYVVFNSFATNMEPEDGNGEFDIFARDRINAVTSRESAGHYWQQGHGPSERASISSTGRYIAFASEADNLVAADTNTRKDIFVRDYLWPGPLVRKMLPYSGLVAGGTVVTLTGDNFTIGTTVYFDGIPAFNINVIDDTTIMCVAPPHAIGRVPVTILNPDGLSWIFSRYGYGTNEFIYRTNAMPWSMLLL